MTLVHDALVSLVTFGSTLVGTVRSPYETYRTISDKSKTGELIYIWLLMLVYFGIAAIVKVEAFRPFLLTKHFVSLSLASLITYVLVVVVLEVLGRLVGGKGTLKSLALCWGYTLLPTVAWFVVTSLLYILLPPPRLDSIKGNVFSLVYLIFSSMLFFWKIVLYYLTLRFALKLDLQKIVIVTICVIPFFVFFSIGMYRLGIFRIPFI